MAAAGGASILEAVMILRGVEDAVSQIRSTASQFDNLRQAANSANDAIAQIRNSSLSLGASSAQVGGTAAAFRSIGLSIEQLRHEAQSFRERLWTDPYAQTAFGRTMLPARMGGPQNELKTLDDAIKMLRETREGEERLYLARRLGLEAMLPLADADERHYEAMRKEGERTGSHVDDEVRRLRANNDASSERLRSIRESDAVERERARLRFSNWWQEHVSLPWAEAWRLRSPESEAAERANGRIPTPRSPFEAHARALNRNTEALNTMNKQYANASVRAQQALPRGLSGSQFQNEALRLGAFEA